MNSCNIELMYRIICNNYNNEHCNNRIITYVTLS